MNPETLTKAVAAVLDDKKALDITAFKTTEQTIIADYFVVCTGTSTTHVKALAGELEHAIKEKHGLAPRGVEGRSSGWILLDYETVLVHIFLKDQRDYYNLERLWEDSERITIEN